MNETTRQVVEEVGRSWRYGPSLFVFGVLAVGIVAASAYGQHLDRQFVNRIVASDIKTMADTLREIQGEQKQFQARVIRILEGMNTETDAVVGEFFRLQADRFEILRDQSSTIQTLMGHVDNRMNDLEEDMGNLMRSLHVYDDNRFDPQ